MTAGACTSIDVIVDPAATLGAGDGSNTNPYADIFEAYNSAVTLAVLSSTTCSISIYLTTNGDHFTLRNMNSVDFQVNDAISDWSTGLDITIKPLPCSLASAA